MVLLLQKIMKARRFKENVCSHVYQRTRNRFNIFYDLKDYLVYYTIFSIAVRRYGVDVLGLCLMIDHIHMLVSAPELKTLSDFVSFVTSVFVREYNSSIGRSGPLFEERFGSAPKKDSKKLRSAIIYLGNNPVERKICIRAEQYRWNFIAYLASTHPFSDKLVRSRASYHMKKAMKEVDICRSTDKYLNHAILSRMMDRLTPLEKNQLADYIISSYFFIDRSALMSNFNSYEEMLTSMRSTTGSEHDLKEYFDRMSDNVYRDMIKIARNTSQEDVRSVIASSPERKFQIAEDIQRHTAAPLWQIAKFLHLEIKNATH